MRRILRKIAEDDLANLGDISTLAEPAAVDDVAEPSRPGASCRLRPVFGKRCVGGPAERNVGSPNGDIL
jgi:hypothetical protein